MSAAIPRGLHQAAQYGVKPRHLLGIKDLSAAEFAQLVQNSYVNKQTCRRLGRPVTAKTGRLLAQTVAMIFTKRSTRTRVSTEAAVKMLGGHPMFLGRDDIQLGVNESVRDSAVVISSMVSAIVARVHDHSEITDLAAASSVPVINALSADHHPLQTIADFQVIYEALRPTEAKEMHKRQIDRAIREKSKRRAEMRALMKANPGLGPGEEAELDLYRDRDLIAPTSEAGTKAGTESKEGSPAASLGLEGLKIAWIGDSNNVLYDLASACIMTGVDISVATPRGYEIPDRMVSVIESCGRGVERAGVLTSTNLPEEAIKDADVIVTDTWISMGFEAESAKRIKDFDGFQVTEELASRGGAKEGWKFLHCLPRHQDEVSDDVFYGPRSLVFPEAQNRLWAAFTVLDSFVVERGDIQPTWNCGMFLTNSTRNAGQDRFPISERGQS